MGVVRRFRKANRRERGQMLIIFALLVIPVTFAVGAVAVDASLWQSERRGAQKDADLSALAGALSLAQKTPDAAEATVRAGEALADNDEAGNAGSDPANIDTLTVDGSCFEDGTSRPDAVTINLEHVSRTFFLDAFGISLAPQIGAHAKACAGAATTVALKNLLPFDIAVETSPCFDTNGAPIYTAMCVVEAGAQGGNQGGRQLLNLEPDEGPCSVRGGGVSNTEDMIVEGAQGSCSINTTGTCSQPYYDCVLVQPGNAKEVLDGIKRRIALETRGGPCDPDNDGYHDFADAVTVVFDTGDETTSTYEATDCDPATEGLQPSPRLVTIIVLEEQPGQGSSNAYPIYAFAGMFLTGCADERVVVNDEYSAGLDRKCSQGGGGSGGNGNGATSGLVDGWSKLAAPSFNCVPGHPQHCTPTPTRTASATPTRTNTPGPTATSTATPVATATLPLNPTSTPTTTGGPGGGPPGRVNAYGKFVNLITTGTGTGAPNSATTIFSISLEE